METVTTTVRPCSTTLGKTTKLSMIDQIAPRDYVATYYFFRLPAGTDNVSVYSALERGFHTTVTQMPELMYCICKSAGHRDELELRLHGDSGATITMKDFTCAGSDQRWTPGTFDELERNHFPLQDLPQTHVLAQTEFPGQTCLPTLAMQANFIEGGLVLTSCLHHTVCDGTGNFVFYSLLAQHIAAATAGHSPEPLTDTAISFLDRKTVIDPEADVQLDQFPDWKLVEEHDAFLNPCDYDPALSPPVQFSTYFISESKLRKLRDQLSTQEGKRPSTTEAVCAFLWQHVVRARNTDCELYPETKLSVTVNTRSRMRNPVCSPAYWGNLSEPNAVARMPTRQFCEAPSSTPMTTDVASEIFEPDHISAAEEHQQLASSSFLTTSAEIASEIFEPDQFTTARELQQVITPTRPSSLCTAALRVKQAIAAVDSTAVRRLVGLLQQMDKATSLTWNVDRWPGPDMLIVCINAAQFNHIDFGAVLGCSEAFRCSIGKPDGRPDGRCFIWPPRHRDGKGMEVMLQYDVETLGRLRGCGEFRKFFEWRN